MLYMSDGVFCIYEGETECILGPYNMQDDQAPHNCNMMSRITTH